MPTGEDRRLKLVKGAPTTASNTSRSVTRRSVTRRVPRQSDPVAAILERLDEEPVDLSESGEPQAEEVPARVAPAGRRAARDATIDDGTTADDDPAEADAADDDPAKDGGTKDGGTKDGGTDDTANGTDVAGKDGRAPRRRLRFARPAPGRQRVVGAVLVVALCAALALTGVFGRLWYQDRALDQAHQQALAAAKQTTINFVSISAASVDGDLQRIDNGATGDFKDQFTRGQSQVRQAVVENKVESRGSILRAGLVSGDLRTAVVLVAVDATVKNVHAPNGNVSHYRIQVDVTKDPESGTWLVSKLQFVG
jgi:Mce-associated membrane protein